MKTRLLTLWMLFLGGMTYAQESTERTTTLSYQKEIPKEDTYKVTKNLTGKAIPVTILEEINVHRKFDENTVWVVNSKLEILIYPFGMHVDTPIEEHKEKR